MLKSINPYTLEELSTFAEDKDSEIASKISRAAKAFQEWRRTTFEHRADRMRAAAQRLRDEQERLSQLITAEMGKVIAESRAEIQKCANACDYFANHAEKFLRDIPVSVEHSKSFIAFQPLGPVLAIMPWNFPFWQVFRFAAPALMAGNVGLLKHAANVTGCSLAIAQIFREAGFPEGCFQSLLVDSKKAEGIIGHDDVKAVTLTGSEYAGTQVAAAAGKNLKKTVLELGGSDPFVVLRDADIELAARTASQSRMQNAGQSCIAAKRFIVERPVYNDFLKKFTDHVSLLRQGDPLASEVTTGPLARLDLADGVEKQLKQVIDQGGALVTGGNRNKCNFQPTIVENVTVENIGFREEIFGPVACVARVNDEKEAIRLANENRYGLGGSVWTQDRARGELVARELETGCVFVNSLMRSDQRLPFGGIKKSGYGRELSELGIKEFMNAKTISVW